jgi:hypothetical protein
MEKKGDLVNQLAIISDLLEKANIESKSININFELDNSRFLSVLDTLQIKNGNIIDKTIDTITVTIGVVDITFNKSNA